MKNHEAAQLAISALTTLAGSIAIDTYSDLTGKKISIDSDRWSMVSNMIFALPAIFAHVGPASPARAAQIKEALERCALAVNVSSEEAHAPPPSFTVFDGGKGK